MEIRKTTCKRNGCLSLGYTLFELLLALMLMSALTLSVIGYMSRQATTAKVERTAGDIKLILQASLNFYVAKNRLPSQLDELKQTHFLAENQSLLNPWQNGYELIPQTNKQFFAIQTKLPKPLATRVAALLPATDVNEEQDMLTTYLILPKRNPLHTRLFTDSGSNTSIKKIAVSRAQWPMADAVSKAKCAQGEEEKIYILPAAFAKDKSGLPITDVTAYALDGGSEFWGIELPVNALQPYPTSHNVNGQVVILACVKQKAKLGAGLTQYF